MKEPQHIKHAVKRLFEELKERHTMKVELLTMQNCPRCEALKARLKSMGITYQTIDMEADTCTARRADLAYENNTVPVLRVVMDDGSTIATGHPDAEHFEFILSVKANKKGANNA